MALSDFLHGVEVIDIDDEIRPIRTVRSSIIGLVGTAGWGELNKPTMVTNRREAVTKFGEWRAGSPFTIPKALDAIYDQGSAVVIVINVLDIVTNRLAVANESVTFNQFNGIAEVAQDFISDVVISGNMSVVLELANEATAHFTLPANTTVVSVQDETGATTYADPADYTVTDFDDNGVTKKRVTRVDGGAIPQGGKVLLTYDLTGGPVQDQDYILTASKGQFSRIIAGTRIIPQSTMTVDYNHVDPTAVTLQDFIGGVDENTGQYKGVHALLGGKAEVGFQPRILIAPEWTSQKPDLSTRNAVVSEMLGIADRLRAVIIADGPNTTDEAAYNYRQDWGTKRLYICDPAVKRVEPGGNIVDTPYSSVMAGVISRTDNEFGFWTSPSNKNIYGIVGVGRHVEFALGDENARANLLNEQEVTTIIREEGFRTWGNRTTSNDPKWAFLQVVRTNDMVAESIMQGHLWAVDRNITKNFVESVVEGVNAYLRKLKNDGAILGGKAWADPELNLPSVIASGQLYIDYEFTPIFPAERITFRSHLVYDYVKEIFD